MSLLIIDFMGLLGSIKSIEFYPLQKLQELVFVKEVYKSDKRKTTSKINTEILPNNEIKAK